MDLTSYQNRQSKNSKALQGRLKQAKSGGMIYLPQLRHKDGATKKK